MSHVRTQIRAALAALLTGLATTGQNVYTRRLRPVRDDQLPCLLVYTGDEGKVDTLSIGFQPEMLREIEVTVEAVVKTVHDDGSTDLDDTFDQIHLEVDAAINASTASFTLGGLLRSGLVPAEPALEIDTDAAETAVGILRMHFRAAYQVRAGAADTAR